MHQTLTFVVSDVRILSNSSSGAHTWADYIKVQTTFSIRNPRINGLLKRYQSWVYLNFEGKMPNIWKKRLGSENHRGLTKEIKMRYGLKTISNELIGAPQIPLSVGRGTKFIPFFERFWNLWIWSHLSVNHFLANQWDWSTLKLTLESEWGAWSWKHSFELYNFTWLCG